MKIRLLCEGNLDGRIGQNGTFRGAAVVILDRLISEKLGRQLNPSEIEPGRLPKLIRGHGFRRKIKQAIKEAEADGDVDMLVVLVDRDKPDYKSRIDELRAGIEEMTQKVIASHTVAGMAIEELEAWLIADHNLLTTTFGAAKGVPKPESQRDPKSEFIGVLREAGIGHLEGYDRAAREMNFEIVAGKCKAFKQFTADVRETVPNE